MILKLKKIILLAGVGLVAVGAITPVVASCSKSSNNSTDPDLLYTSKSVEDLFEQFIEQYKTLALSKDVEEEDIATAISGFKAQLKEKEEETADLPDSDKFAQRSEWIMDLAKQYDIVLVEWQHVDNIRDSLFEGIAAEGGYDESTVAAGIYQQELIEYGINENQSLNEYLDTVSESNYTPAQSNFINYSPTLFPRTHAYALRSALKPINNKINAVAAKANLLSQMVYDYLKPNNEKNILSYMLDTNNTTFQEGAIEYNASGIQLDYTNTKTSLVGEDGNYLDASGSAYRLLTKNAQKALFNYSYLDFTDESGRKEAAFEGAKIFDDDKYDVDIALHVKAPDSDELLAIQNFNDFSVTVEYDVIVTNTHDLFSPFKDNNERYDTAENKDIHYFALVGSRTLTVSMPTDVQTDHSNAYLSDTLKYDDTHPESIVKALGVTFSNITKDSRGANGRPTTDSKLTEDDINHFYFLTATSEENDAVSFTSQYGENGEIASVKNKWLIPRDADAAVHLQIDGFTNSLASYFGSEYAKAAAKNPKSLTISEANAFLEQTLGRDSLKFAVRIDDSGTDEGKDPLVASYVKLGVYFGEAIPSPAVGAAPIKNLISVAAHDNVNKLLSETTQLDSWEQQYKTLYDATSPEYGPNQFYLPLFASARQASNMKFCAGLLEKDNLAKHAKIIEFIDYPVIRKFDGYLKDLLSVNTTYASLNIVMSIAYAIKLVYDCFILSTCWAVFPLAVAAALQIVSDLISIGFLIYEIVETFRLMDRLNGVIDIFDTYINKTTTSTTSGYKAIKAAYDAYLAQLNIYKDVTKSPTARVNAADAVANGLYDKFMVLLTSNLFDFVNSSIKLEAGFNGKSETMQITPDLGWSAMKGVAELAPFLIHLIMHIIFSVLFICFVKVAGVALSNLMAITEDTTAILIMFWGADFGTAEVIAQLTSEGLTLTLDMIAEVDAARSLFKQIATAKDMMKISGIAGIILGVLDILFTVGYSILTSSIAADVNDLLDAYLVK